MIIIAKVLVTGCAGFIGSNLTGKLIEDGNDVTGIDDLTTGRKENIEGLKFKFVHGTVNDKATLMRCMKRERHAERAGLCKR